MSSLHKQAMEAVLRAAELDVTAALEERDIKDRNEEEADEAVYDVAILHAFRIFTRICEANGLSTDAWLFADIAGELAEDLSQEGD